MFQASRCHGKGIEQARKPRKAKVEKTGLGMGPGYEDILMLRGEAKSVRRCGDGGEVREEDTGLSSTSR